MVEKAKLVEVKFKTGEPPKPEGGHDVNFQFNPQTLKLTVANENKGGDQAAGSTKHFTGKSTTKLAVELLFDTTQFGSDVRLITAKVRYFIQPHPSEQKGKLDAPPGVQFKWGTFIFSGVVDSLQETLDYFAEDGTPLRATIALGISQQEIVFPTDQETPGTASGKPGQAPLNIVRNKDKDNDNGNGGGDNMPGMAGRNGNSSDWKAIAAANNIDNPLRLKPGTLLDLNAGVSARAGVSLGAQGGISASAGISGGIGFSAGLGGGVGFSAGAEAGIGASAGISAGAGIGGGISAGIGANAGAGISAGASAGVGASAGFNAGAGIGASAGVSGGFGGSIGASVGGGASAQAGISGRASVVAGGGFGAGVDIPGR